MVQLGYTSQNSSDSLFSYHPRSRHSSDVVSWKGEGCLFISVYRVGRRNWTVEVQKAVKFECKFVVIVHVFSGRCLIMIHRAMPGFPAADSSLNLDTFSM